tara:strand:- start:1612 stop:2055 length:444 start_codon:yes stop_codon:yes gene_type:complete
MSVDTDYKAVSSGIAIVRDLRVSVEATRKALKEDSLAWGRKVDAEAKRITEQLKEIEEPLRLVKQQIDDAKEAAKKAAEADRLKAIADEAARAESKPDIEKVRAFGAMIGGIEYPRLETLQGKQLLFDVNVYVYMQAIVKLCKEFQS